MRFVTKIGLACTAILLGSALWTPAIGGHPCTVKVLDGGNAGSQVEKVKAPLEKTNYKVTETGLAKNPRKTNEVWYIRDGWRHNAEELASILRKDLGEIEVKKWTWGGEFELMLIVAPAKAAPPPAIGLLGNHALVGQPAPGFTLRKAAGKSGDRFTKMEKGKRVLMVFGRNSCDPCRRAFEWAESVKAAPLVKMAVFIDRGSKDLNEMKKWWEKKGLELPMFYDRFNIVMKRYKVDDVPMIFVVGVDGKVEAHVLGWGADQAKAIEQAIE